MRYHEYGVKMSKGSKGMSIDLLCHSPSIEVFKFASFLRFVPMFQQSLSLPSLPLIRIIKSLEIQCTGRNIMKISENRTRAQSTIPLGHSFNKTWNDHLWSLLCAVCIRQDSTPMVLLRWNQMEKIENIHILHLVDKSMCLLCCCSARFWEMRFLASEPWKWRTKVTLTTRSWLKLYNSCQTKRWPWRPVWMWNDFKQNVWAPFLLSGASTRGTRDMHTSPNCLYQQFLAVTRTESWSRQSFSSKSGSRNDFIDVCQGLSFQEYPGILGGVS